MTLGRQYITLIQAYIHIKRKAKEFILTNLHLFNEPLRRSSSYALLIIVSKAPQCSSVAGYVRQQQDTRARLIDETRNLRAYVYLRILYTRYKIPFQMFSEIPS